MRKKITKKLELSKETLRNLSEREVQEVVGGITEASCKWPCFATEDNTNSACHC